MAKGRDQLAERLLEELKKRSSPVTTLELAKAASATRKLANPVLYGLMDQGKIRLVQQQPPSWEIARTPRSEFRSFTRGPGASLRARGRGRGAWLCAGARPVHVGEERQGRQQGSGFKGQLNPPVGDVRADDLEVRVVGLLGRFAHPQTALELARALGYPSRKAVNPTLYALEKSGAVLRIEGQGPPKWSLRTSQQVATHRSDPSVQSVPPFEVRSQPHFSGNPFTASSSRATEEEFANLSVEESMDTEDSSLAGPSMDLSHIPPENIKERLLAVMEAEPSVLRTDLELAKAIGSGYTRSRVRPCLEQLAGEAKVRKIGLSFPVRWSVARKEEGSVSTLSNLQAPLASQVYSGAIQPAIGSVVPSSMVVSPLAGGSSLAVSSINDLNRNPVSALNEYCQVNKLELKLDVVREFGPPHRKHFVVGARFGDSYFEAESTNKKEGKRLVADLALQHVMASQVTSSTGVPVVHSADYSLVTPMQTQTASVSGSVGGDGFSNAVAKMSHDIYVQLQGTVAVPQPGRKVVAAFVMEDTLSSGIKVVSVGSGTRCITGDQMSLTGLVVNDSHAEVVARRSLMRFFYQQLAAHSRGDQDTIFISSAATNTSRPKVKVRDNLKFHLYISTAPCGDSAQFSRAMNRIVIRP